MSFGVYLHVPFCARKCEYCDFYSITQQTTGLQERFLQAAIKELQLRLEEREWSGQLDTIYLGGGTPGLIEAERYRPLFHYLKQNFSPAGDIEITVEANPESVTVEWLSGMRSMGVNRLSLGVQSWQDPLLRRMGRLHDARQATDAVSLAREQGFTNISLDFIFGIPGQTTADLEEELREVLKNRPDHISWYCLTWEQGTPLYRRLQENPGLKLPDDEEAIQFTQIHDRLTAAGYEHYEVSSYCLPGFESRHNTGYWVRKPCLGIGPAASSFDGTSRWTNRPDLQKWLAALETGRLPEHELEAVRGEELLLETLYLGLRRISGISRQELQQVLGKRVTNRLLKTVESSRFAEYIQCGKEKLKLTLPGILLLDEIILDLSRSHE